MIKKQIVLLPWLFLAAVHCGAREQRGQREPSIANVTRVEPLVANLLAPISLVHTESFRDGGTAAVLLKDAAGKYFLFCLDRRIAAPSEGGRRHVYVGIAHPSEPPAARTGVTRKLPIRGDEEKALLKLLQTWRDTSVPQDKRANLSRILKLNYQESSRELQRLSEADFELFRVFDVIDDLEKKETPGIDPAALKAEAAAAVDGEKARKLVDELVDDLVNDRRSAIWARLDEGFFVKVLVNGEVQSWSKKDKEQYFKYKVDSVNKYFGVLLGCEYESDNVGTIFHVDGHRRHVRTFEYACKVTQKQELNPHLRVEVGPDGDRLAVKGFHMNVSP